MNRPLRILHVEDSEDDHLLVGREIRRSGIVSTTERVFTRETFREALFREKWDIIVADYSMPGFSGLDALRILNESRLDIPFILVSGTVGEDIAVRSMKLGASDYLLKGQLARLGPAIEREVREAEVRHERRVAEEALKSADDSLRHTVSLLRATIESTADGILAVGDGGRITIHNKKFRAVSGVPQELVDAGDVVPVIADIVSRLFNPDDFTGIAGRLGERVLSPANRGGFRHLEFKDGRSVEAFVVPQWLESRCVGHVLCMRDVTERKRAEEARHRIETQLFQSQKMEALGSLAGGVAHDFNNLLSVILNYAELLRTKVVAGSDSSRYIDHMQKAGQRAADLVKQILLFSRRQKQELRPMRLQDAIADATQLIRSTLPRTVVISTDLDPATPPVLADTTQLHQVLMNLCINASQAMPSRSGNIRIAVGAKQVSAETVAANPDARAGEYATLTVSDDGAGMTAETLSHIFEPFFTTKVKGEGTGLGLAVVHGIVRSHNGFIRVESQPGAGTTFRIHIPVYRDGTESRADTAPAAASAPERPKTPDRSRRIFFVDDEPAICAVTEQILTGLGYRITAFSEPRKALEAYLADPAACDLLLADVNMPHYNGVELAARFREKKPALPVLLISGYSGAWTAENLKPMGVIDLLQKPVSPRQIAARLDRIFAAMADTESGEQD